MTRYGGLSAAKDYNKQKREIWKRLAAQGEVNEAQKRFDELWRREALVRSQAGSPVREAERLARMQALAVIDKEYPVDIDKQKAHAEKEGRRLEEIRKAKETGRRKAAEEIEQNSEADKRKAMNERNLYVQRELEGKPTTSLYEDLEFARQNMHLIGDPEDKGTWLMRPSLSPSASAWSMLMYACTERKEFQRMATRELVAREKELNAQAHQLELERIRRMNELKEAAGIEGSKHLRDEIEDIMKTMGNKDE